MNGHVLQLTLREWRDVLGRRRLVATFAIIVILFAFIGPFGTLERLNPIPRFSYWALVHGLAWSTAILCSLLSANLLRERLKPLIVRLMIGSALASMPIGAEVTVVDALLAGGDIGLETFAQNVLLALPLCLLFSLLTYLTLGGHEPAAPSADVETPQEPSDPLTLLRRLRPENRGPFLRLSADDHYTEIVTGAGRELVLIRFADALAELRQADGMQVHRSHWVARVAIRDMRREGSRMTLLLSDGSEVPVSRANVAAVRAWLAAGK